MHFSNIRPGRDGRCRLLLATLAIVAAATCRFSHADPVAGPAERAEKSLIIRPAPNADWNASLRDVEKVLYSAAGSLWCFFPGRQIEPILVEPKGGPIVLFKRGPEGQYRVRLATGNTYWSQYAFQFTHEFCHILCNYRDGGRGHKWFEESLCETASLFALRRMAETWKTDPPYPNWKSYAGALGNYAGQRLDQCRLPADTTLARWYQTNAEQLRSRLDLRENQRVVAGVLLPLFEQHPEHWAAVGYLNLEELPGSQSFPEYLAAWHRGCPKKHQSFVRRIADRFGIVLPTPATP